MSLRRTTTTSKSSMKDVSGPIFSPSVDTIVFTDYEPFQKYKQTISFRNNDTNARRLKVLSPSSRFFTISHTRREINDKVAPGLDISYDVTFSPEEKIDYSSQLMVITDREQFTIPIHAVGIRAKINLPSVITFTDSPVKCATTHDFYVQNIGKCSAAFSLHAPAPFSVTPNEVANLNIGEGVQVLVTFTPDKIMTYNGELQIHFQNGDVQSVMLEGTAANTNVKLDCSIKELPDTFVTEVSQTSIKIINKSDILVRYVWKLFATQEDEERHKQRKVNQLSHEMEEGSRSYRNQKREIESDEMNFVNKNFSIFPLSGEIWPGMEEYINIDFHPQMEAFFENIAFCEVTGRENRLPIKITGRGKGPDTSFSFTDLNIGEVFVNAPHEYEIQLDNKGTIPAKYELIPTSSVYGSKFKFTPNSGTIPPCSSETIHINFNCDAIGEFVEIFRWRIQDKTDELTICFTGCVVGPLFRFLSEYIDFGVVSFNFLNTAYVDLENSCEIPMEFRLRVPEDGTMLNREFDIIPSSGTILPVSTKRIKLEFLSNTLKLYKSNLVVDIIDVGDNLLSIPIYAECVVPDILLSSGKINFGDCFLGYTYTQTLDLGNSSNLPAKYEVILPRGEDREDVMYS